MCMEQRSVPYSYVQQSMVQELHKCTKTWRKARRIQNFSEWPSDENYPHDAMHVYAQNVLYAPWNENRLKLLPGREFTNIATDSKKDDCTELTNVKSLPIHMKQVICEKF